jgi:type I restriction-modification system DNA methylase subunit
MFPYINEEELEVTQKHLDLIQGLLYGDVDAQQKLFFFSYQFDIIPLDLISSIYEEFYHGSTDEDRSKQARRQDGAFYTPSVLAEFVLSRLLTKDILKSKPRILDPSCGSGIFLVEAFRRIVRYEWHLKGESLTFDELKQILKQQICGIEMNPEAAGIAAFSLYLSMLHYLEPPAIDKQIKAGNKLPNIVASTNKSENYYHCILPGNAFDINHIDSNAVWHEKFKSESFDIVVGNPPWGAPGKSADIGAKENHKKVLDWCDQKKYPIGDREHSQAFL